MPSFVDFRSDTVTRPTAGVREAMAKAEVGDDVYGEDPTVNAFETKMAAEAATDAALFVTTGTQGGKYCQASTSARAGAAASGSASVPTEQSGDIYNFDAVLKPAIRPDNVHFPRTRLILVENTHMGQAVEPEYYRQLRAWVDTVNKERRHPILIHCDGARLVNACIKFGVPLSSFTKYFDSVSICFSKGLGAAMGSVLCGSKDFIQTARRWRKAVGGGMRQVGLLAAGCAFCWTQQRDRLRDDHGKAELLAGLLSETSTTSKSTHLHVEYPPQSATNMVFFRFLADDAMLQQGRVRDCETVEELFEHFDARMREKGFVMGHPKYTQGMVRIITHLDTSEEDVRRLAAEILAFCEEKFGAVEEV
eukprot:CAMPEP_0179008010 /NCGR_PEP_ID=MMETSP0795-20121207/15471_1 /TAXON_ID=88552 /ORGANISM="Amoebophrya sp., Strain Ameob2" /LENGTH=363 /DNA_ID=CAMNT_0020703033 /DNA_START=455 /DNA_END=1547 /DNA_ORIENTATION=+